eukprot:scaffold467755_cov18-Prasinocladus_malaysianus.AAC.1
MFIKPLILKKPSCVLTFACFLDSRQKRFTVYAELLLAPLDTRHSCCVLEHCQRLQIEAQRGVQRPETLTVGRKVVRCDETRQDETR